MASRAAAMFYDGQLNISGGRFMSAANININNSKNLEFTAFTKLQTNAVPGALHDSGGISDPPKCHSGTREDVLAVLIEWALTTIYEYPIRWLNGAAGAGKSAIMRSFAEMLVEHGLLLASFFFYRSDARRNSAENLISTIAYQLYISVPPLQPWIERGIESNPLIFGASLPVQIQTLILDPLLHYFYDPKSIIITPFPRIILIDGLDECSGDETQQEILRSLCQMVKALPIPIAIVFASRPEHQIRSAFELGSLSETASRISLDDNFNADGDIWHYYHTEFEKIRRAHPMRHYLDARWPSRAVIRTLVRNASGQFVYAATVIKFIKATRHNPAVRLQIILGQADRGRSKPFQQLDLLYALIFRDVNPEILPATLRVLGILLTPPTHGEQAYQSPQFIESLLGFPAGHARFLLLDLESLLTVRGDEEAIRIDHTSLSDFLFDKSRAGDFFTDRGLIYAEIAKRCIKLFCNYQTTTSRPLLASYLQAQLRISLRKATPTPHLRHKIISCNTNRLLDLAKSETVCILALLFLMGLKESRYPDAESLYQIHLCPPALRTVVNFTVIKHWLQPEQQFRPALLFILLLALTNAKPDAAMYSLLHAVPANGETSDIHPGTVSTVGWNYGLFHTDEDWRSLASVFLGVINHPTGLLHDQNWKEALTNVTLSLMRNISWESGADSHLGPLVEILPFLLSVSLVRNDLTSTVQQARRAALRNGLYYSDSDILGVAFDIYLQSVAEGSPRDADMLSVSDSLRLGMQTPDVPEDFPPVVHVLRPRNGHNKLRRKSKIPPPQMESNRVEQAHKAWEKNKKSAHPIRKIFGGFFLWG